jgi:hypothetical protein
MRNPICRVIVLAISIVFLAGAQIDAPHIGAVRYPDRTVHSLYGFTGNVIVGPQVSDSADAASFSDAGGLVARAGRISLLAPDFSTIASYDSGESAPILNVGSESTSAIAWLPSQAAILRWTGSRFELLPVADASMLGNITSIRVLNRTVGELLVDNGDGTVSSARVSLKTGDLISVDLLSGVHAPAYRHGNALLYLDQQGLELATDGAIVASFPMQSDGVTFESVSSHWLHVTARDTGRSWLLYLRGSNADISELPPAASNSSEALKEGGN